MTHPLVPLRRETLTELSDDILRPNYGAADLTPGIVHVGVGNFHRAHQAWYQHRLMQQGEALDWAIVGAGVRSGDAVMRDKLLAQDCLTTLIELRPDGRSAEVIGPMIDFLPVQADNAALIAQLAHPSTRIVSLTVTEGGYFVDPATGAFDATHPEIIHDIAQPDRPCTVFGAIVAALRLRRERGNGPFTVQSSDNLQGNGAVTRSTVVSLARQVDPDLADWIDSACSFPNSMVDCIVPATDDQVREAGRAMGIDDAAPVTHEFFRQWVIEDDFCAGRPNWDRAGATFTSDVHAYEAMKIRILNAGHQVLANAGELLGLPTIADCMAHPTLLRFFQKVIADNVIPYVDAVPEYTPHDYAKLIERRFANPAIRDTTRRVAFDGSSRHPGFVLPIIRDALTAGGGIEGLALVEALWARMCAGTREDGSEIAPNDPQWPVLQGAAIAARGSPLEWLENSSVYGDLVENETFATCFAEALAAVWTHGVEATLTRYIGSSQR